MHSGSSQPNTKFTERRSSTFKTRSAEAARNLHAALRLPVDMSDAATLSAALLEVIAEESQRSPNPRIAEAVCQRYQELFALRSTSAKRDVKYVEPLIPLRYAEGTIDPFAPPDPKKLIYVYGQDKLARALSNYTLFMLKQTAAKIEQERPGTKPSNRGRKDAVIEYIVKYAS
jgi:hypothetical protein